MLAVQPLRGPSGGDERDDGTTTTTMGCFPGRAAAADEASLLCDISFSDLFMGIDDGDVLPDLELDPADIFADFSSSCDAAAGGREEDSAATAAVEQDAAVAEQLEKENMAAAAMVTFSEARSASPDDGEKGQKSSTAAVKGSQGKRKAKVDWTPELHRRFVQAVEQLGIDKAVPSRILELMGIDCLTRHNIASHLQKYRSHRKHLLAREAEATSWTQRRQMYAAKRADVDANANPWLAAGPAIGFLPPLPPLPPQPAVGQTLRQPPPLHVWGHPPAEVPLLHMWPQRPPWPPQAPPLPLPPPRDPSFWHHHYQIRGTGGEGWLSHAMMKGSPCFPPAAFARPPIVPGIVPHHPIAAMFRPVPSSAMAKNSSSSQLQFDAHPSRESIDAAIGDVIEKPWLPLPLGLKPPSLDSVLVELQKQGVSEVP